MQSVNNIKHTYLKNNPFRVPNDYFDLLPQQIGEKITQISAHETLAVVQTRSFRKSINAQLALAASFVLMIGIGYGLIRLITPNRTDAELFDPDHISLFNTYTLLQNDEWEKELDSESIITFLTEHRISPYSIAALE